MKDALSHSRSHSGQNATPARWHGENARVDGVREEKYGYAPSGQRVWRRTNDGAMAEVFYFRGADGQVLAEYDLTVTELALGRRRYRRPPPVRKMR